MQVIIVSLGQTQCPFKYETPYFHVAPRSIELGLMIIDSTSDGGHFLPPYTPLTNVLADIWLQLTKGTDTCN